jgi:hypothetical protein
MRGWKSSNFGRSTFKLKIQLFVLTKNLTKQHVLIAKWILKLDDSRRKTLGGWIITYIRVRVGDVSWSFAHEAKVSEVVYLALGPLILLWAGGVIAGEVEVTESSTHSGHHLLELLLLVTGAVLLLVVILVIVVPLGIVVLVGGGVEFLPLGAVDDEVGVVTTLKAALGDLLLSLRNLCKVWNFLTNRAISSSGMLSYCSSEAADKKDKANSKADESVVLVGLVSHMATNTSTSNKSLTSKRSIMVRTTFPRQLMRFQLTKQFFCIQGNKISRFL